MSSTHQNGKLLNKPRPDSGYYDSDSPMEVDGTSRRSSHTSRSSMNSSFGSFSNLNGSISESPSPSNGRDLVLTAGMSVRSPATRRRGGNGPMGASVTRVIRSEDGPVDNRSTTVLRPNSGGSDGASVRPNYSTRPGACDNATDDVLGVITIGDVKDEEEDHKDQNGTAGQKEETGFGCGRDQKPHRPPDVVPQRPVLLENTYGCRGDQKPHRHPDTVPQKPIIPDPPKPQVWAFEIFVKNADGKSYTFTVMKSDSVDSLLQKINNRLNINADQFWLNFAGKRLTRGKTLGSYGIQEHSTIFVELRLRGG